MMLRRLTTRQKELFTGLAALAIALALLAGRDSEFGDEAPIPIVATPETAKQNVFDPQAAHAFDFQKVPGLRLAVPGARFYDVQFNSLGFRGPELDLQRNDIIRIAYMGSSTTLNRHVFPDDKSWPALTTAKLGEAFPDCQFTYQNIGIPGLNSRNMTAHYREMLTQFLPDIVVVLNDDRSASVREMARESGISSSETEKLNFTKAQLLSHYAKDLPELLEAIVQQGAIPVLLSLGQRVRENQTAAEQATVSRPEIKDKPYMTVESLLRSAQWYNEKNREIADDLQVTYVEWHKRVPGDAAYFLDFRHFNFAGSALIAEVLVDELQHSSIFTRAIFTRFGCKSGQNKPGIVFEKVGLPSILSQ